MEGVDNDKFRENGLRGETVKRLVYYKERKKNKVRKEKKNKLKQYVYLSSFLLNFPLRRYAALEPSLFPLAVDKIYINI